MADFVPKNKGSRQLFKNPILERLTRTHISVPLIIFTLYSFGLLFWSVTNTSLNAYLTISLFFIGWLAFSWVEYNIHRHIFHLPAYNEFRAKLQYTMHGVHHEFPKDKDRLAMPPLVSVIISTILLLLLRLVMGDLVFAFLPGFLTGYACYLGVHYMIHAYQPPKNFLKVLWINHSIHHYKDGEVVFGVSSPLWDYIYGTMKEVKK
ncbi:MAG: sterol desaturase family protein [Cyclobacteriaceae bacterium]|nr:sterol desaturase family protein [Cyclobacteriaceae bacterium]